MIEQLKITLRNAAKVDPLSIDDYINAGGYTGLKKARETDRVALIEELEKSSVLRGRGGAGFNTGLKWSGAFKVNSDEKYVVCNADEGEPGTYKDRTIIENDPHTVIEGVLICAYAIGARNCYIYCRGEYENAIKLLRNAIEQARERGICGDVEVRVHSGAGSYVCGEETALLNSLEGKRAEPRLKPPFPTVAGFRAKPTVVNNVETFATVPVVVEKGADWFSAIGSSKYPGTKIFSLSGDVVHKGCFEVPTDSKLSDIIFDLGGGVPNGRKLKAVQLGGSSCSFFTPSQLDTPVDFESLREIGGSLGSGATLLIDDSHNIVDILADIAHFFNHESCGKCTPCREGTLRVAQIMDKFAAGKGWQKDLDQIADLANLMNKSCFCPLGQSATTAITSAMKLFPEDFHAKMEV